jgi:hypothetical protein
MFDTILEQNIEAFKSALFIVWSLLPYFLPLAFGIISWKMWLRFVKLKTVAKEGGLLLEIKLPREILKSPAAMELIFLSMHQSSKPSLLEGFLKGKIRPYFSLEIVSIEGKIHFFIWTWPKFRRLLESQIYAQYPDVEIHEAEDYTQKVYHSGKLKPSDPKPLFASAFECTKPDVYPIKTYVDYGMEKDPKEEFKIDPMTAMLEFLGSIRQGEQVWIQIIVQAHRKLIYADGRTSNKDDWSKAAEKEKAALLKKLKRASDKDDDKDSFRTPTKAEADVINAIERSVAKNGFDVHIRGAYIAEPGKFNPVCIAGLLGCLKQYSSQNLNGFKPGKKTDFDYPWNDFRRHKMNELESKFLNAFKHRSYFEGIYKDFPEHKTMILNTEELATIFHFPGKVASTPTLAKSMSKKSEAPANLPI